MSHGQDHLGGPHGTPGWVKWMGAFVVVLVLLLLALGLLGRGHGPRRHLPSGGIRGAPAAAISTGPLLG